MSGFPTRAEFAAAVGEDFALQLDDGRVLPMRLKACDLRTDTALQECFSLVFVAPVDTPPLQSIRRIRHATLGEMEIFLVPIKLDDAGLRYEAVFNRLLA